MKRIDQPTRFVDDGYPEAREYDNNYLVVPIRGNSNAPAHSLTRLMRATRVRLKRSLRRLLRKMPTTTGRPGSRIAGTRTPAELAQYS